MQRKKFLTNVGAASMAAMIAATAAVPAMAATAYTPVAGTSCNFNKYLIMDAGDNVPNATFSFTVAPGNARSADTADNAVMQVLPGVGTPTIADVTFAPGDTTVTEAGSNIDVARAASTRADGLTAANGVELEAGEKYATKQATVSFEGITFDEPGIYRYIITETANADHAAAGIMHDNDTDRVLDVYVTDDGNGNLVVSSYVLHTDDDDVVINTTMGSADVAQAAAALDDKTDGFTNEVNTKDLVVKKEVTGNQASRDKWFEFTVKASNVNAADKYTVSLADDQDANTTDGNADAASGTNSATIAANQNKTNPTEVTGAQLMEGVKFYLQHGQSVAIRGFALNAGYEVTENAEDYKSTGAAVTDFTNPTATDTDVNSKKDIAAVAGENKAAKTSYLNERSGIVPTAVAAAVTGSLALIGAGAAGIFMTRKKKNRE